eukprot:4448333-Prymnesium_polylepis.1
MGASSRVSWASARAARSASSPKSTQRSMRSSSAPQVHREAQSREVDPRAQNVSPRMELPLPLLAQRPKPTGSTRWARSAT